MLSANWRMLNATWRMPNAECSTLMSEAECGIADARYWILIMLMKECKQRASYSRLTKMVRMM